MRVQREIDDFAVPEEHMGIGLPLSSAWYAERLHSLAHSLVAPYHAEMRDERAGTCVILPIMVVVDDTQGTVVVFDPATDAFVLAERCLPLRGVDLVSCGIRGNAVDCFLAA